VRGNEFNLFTVSIKFEFLMVVTEHYRFLGYNRLSLVCIYMPMFLRNLLCFDVQGAAAQEVLDHVT
jgi:hypothetical protein